MTVLEREHVVCRLGGVEVGIVGLKGFVGGFDGHRLPDFGEPQLRALFADTAEDVAALDKGLREIAHCPVRVVLLHYAPIAETLEGEPPEIWSMLGTDRLAARSSSTSHSSCSTGTRTPGASRARSAPSRSTTSRCR